MRKLILPFLIIFVTQVFGQDLKNVAQKIVDLKAQQTFTENSTLFSLGKKTDANFSEALDKFTVLEFNATEASKIIALNPQALTLVIPSSSGNIKLDLYRSEIFTPDFSVITSTSNNQPVAYKGGVHYQGIISGDYSSIAAISIFDNEVMGMISTLADGNMIIGAIGNDSKGRHVFYNEKDLHAPSGPDCFTTEDHGIYKTKDLQSPSITATKCIRLYWEANYNLYQAKGNSVSNTTNYLTAVFNQSATLYTNDGIPVSLSQIFVWSTPSPYTSTTTSGLLGQFQSYRNSYNGDLGHLIGTSGGGGIAAGFNGFCNTNLDNTQCYSGINTTYANVPTFSWTVEVVTHEQGHLMGSRHTHACVWNGNNTAIDGCGPAAGYSYEGSCSGAPIPSIGGTIMSYCHQVSVGINFTLGFGPQPKTVILNNFNAALCLSTCSGGTTCDVPSGLNTTNITNNAARLNWTAAAGAVSYNVQYRVVGTSTWQTANTTSTTILISSLNALANYEWQAQTVCSGGSSAYSALSNFQTTSTPCGTPAGLSTTAVTSSSATLNWGAVSGATSYNLQWRAGTSGTWTVVSILTGTSYALSSLVNCSTYQFQVQSVCSSGPGSFSTISSFSTTGCTITYCASRSNSTTYEYINKVVLGTISNTSGNNGGYGNFTALSTNLSGGSAYTITLTPGFFGGIYTEYWSVYIDYSRNGSFADAGELVATGSSTSAISRTFTVPASALNGSTRMRVQMKYQGAATNSCTTFTYGEVEDYTVVVSGNAQMVQLSNSEFVDVENSTIEEESFNIYPNPAQNKLNVSFESRVETATFSIYNLEGRQLLLEKQNIREGFNSVEINTSTLPSGIYFVQIENGNDVRRMKFLVAR